MKTIHILCLVLLFSFPAKAQHSKSGFNKTVDSINSILYQTKKVMFIHYEDGVYYVRKISATKRGDVFCIDSLNSNGEEVKRKIFNLLELKSFVRDGNKINLINKSQKKIGEITNVFYQDMRELIKQLDALRFICILYEKEDPKFKCD